MPTEVYRNQHFFVKDSMNAEMKIKYYMYRCKEDQEGRDKDLNQEAEQEANQEIGWSHKVIHY